MILENNHQKNNQKMKGFNICIYVFMSLKSFKTMFNL